MEIAKIKQRLEMLWKEVEKLEASGGGSGDAYTKAETDTLLSAKADKSSTYTKTETNAEIQGAITELDVPSTSATGHVIRSIAQEDGKIAAEAEIVDTTPTLGSTKLCTSGGIYDAIQAAGGGGTDLTPTVITPVGGNFPIAQLSILEKHLPFQWGTNGLIYTYLGEFGGKYNYYCFGTDGYDKGQAYKGLAINKTTGATSDYSERSGSPCVIVLASDVTKRFHEQVIEYSQSAITGDLNNQYNAGVFYISNANNVSNYPSTDPGLLYVDKNYPNHLIQTLTTVGTVPTVFKRIREGGTWGSWYKFEGTVVS